jgi:peptidase M23-like protein
VIITWMIVTLAAPLRGDVGRTGRDGTTSGADGGRDSGGKDAAGGGGGGKDKGASGGGGRGGHDPDAPGHEHDPPARSEAQSGGGNSSGNNNGEGGGAHTGGGGGNGEIAAPSVEGGRAIPSMNPVGPASNPPQGTGPNSPAGKGAKGAPKGAAVPAKTDSNSNKGVSSQRKGADGGERSATNTGGSRPKSPPATSPSVDAKKTQQVADRLAVIDSQFGGASSTLVKPAFSATPLGQPLTPSANVTDSAKATQTKNSKIGGYPGKTRSQGTVVHFGLDDPSTDAEHNDVAHYTGTSFGLVTRAGPAYNNKGQYLGQRVTIVSATPSGTWTSTTMHHKEVLVKVGDTVKPGQAIAKGSGVGDQFKSDQAGKAHVHWEIKHDGKDVSPLSGEKIPKK